MMKDLDTAVLVRDLPDIGLTRGDVGTIVHVYADRQAYEVEFMTLTGETMAVVTLEAGDVRPVAATEVAHARVVA